MEQLFHNKKGESAVINQNLIINIEETPNRSDDESLPSLKSHLILNVINIQQKLIRDLQHFLRHTNH